YSYFFYFFFLTSLFFFFFNATATTEIYTLSLHDALPIYRRREGRAARRGGERHASRPGPAARGLRDPGSPRRTPGAAGAHRGAADRKSTRLNSSHVAISYAVFCLKKKKKT